MKKLLAALVVLLVANNAGAVVSNATRTVSAAPCSGQSSVTITFPFLEKSHITVVKTLIASGVGTTLTQGPGAAGYTVTLPTKTTNGSISLGTACTSSYNLTISRNVPYTQTVSLRSQGDYNPEVIEKALDKNVMMVQQLVGGVAVDSTVATAIDAHEGEADPHTGYHLLAGRSGGQYATGGTGSGDDLTLRSTTHGTKGSIIFGTSAYDEVNNRLGLATTTPNYPLDINGTMAVEDLIAMSPASGDGRLTITDASSLLYLQGGNNATAAELRLYGGTHGTYPGYATLDADLFTMNDRDGFANAALDETNGFLLYRGSIRMQSSSGSSIYGSTAAGGDLNLISTSNATLGTIFFGTDSGFDDVNNRLGIGTTTPTRTLEVRGTIAGRRPLSTFTNAVVISGDTGCGGIFTTSTNGDALALPDADSYPGCTVTLINLGTAGATAVSIRPNAAETIFGECATGPVSFSTANRDACNTGGTSGKGDRMTVEACAANSWCIAECTGNWTVSVGAGVCP